MVRGLGRGDILPVFPLCLAQSLRRRTPMTERNQARDAERLPEEAARRLLERASELEAARSAELSVAELREAAREAGITPGSFEQALAEFRRTVPSSAVPPASDRRWRLAR